MATELHHQSAAAFAKVDAVLAGAKLGFNNALSFLHVLEMHFTSQADLMSHITKGSSYIDHVKESEATLEEEVLTYMFEVDTLERKKKPTRQADRSNSGELRGLLDRHVI